MYFVSIHTVRDIPERICTKFVFNSVIVLSHQFELVLGAICFGQRSFNSALFAFFNLSKRFNK